MVKDTFLAVLDYIEIIFPDDKLNELSDLLEACEANKCCYLTNEVESKATVRVRIILDLFNIYNNKLIKKRDFELYSRAFDDPSLSRSMNREALMQDDYVQPNEMTEFGVEFLHKLRTDKEMQRMLHANFDGTVEERKLLKKFIENKISDEEFSQLRYSGSFLKAITPLFSSEYLAADIEDIAKKTEMEVIDERLYFIKLSSYVQSKYSEEFNSIRKMFGEYTIALSFHQEIATFLTDLELAKYKKYSLLISLFVLYENNLGESSNWYLIMVMEGMFQTPYLKVAFLGFLDYCIKKKTPFANSFCKSAEYIYSQMELEPSIDLTLFEAKRTPEQALYYQALKRSKVAAAYACKHGHIEESQKELFVHALMKEELFPFDMFKNGLTKKGKEAKNGAKKVLFVLIQYVLRSSPLPEKDFNWETSENFQQIVRMFCAEEAFFMKLRDTGYKIKEICVIKKGLDECEQEFGAF